MRKSGWRHPRLLLCLAGLAFVPAARGAPPFDVSDGVVVFEAEDFSTHLPRGVRAWELRTDVPGFSGAGFMVVTNNGADPNSNINVNVATTSPELQYAIHFPTTGTFQVWARGYGLSGTEDSIHAGLDGVLTPSSSNLT